VESRVLSTIPTERVVRHVPASPGRAGRAFARTAGAVGFRVVTYRRVRQSDGKERRERLSDDAYPAMPEVVRFADAGQSVP
jgi:hypothetical protein